MSYEPPITIHDEFHSNNARGDSRQVHQIMADIFKPADSPEFRGDGERKIILATVTLPLNREEFQKAIDTAAPGYKLLTWWIPEEEDEF